jgi:hypothetical protein
LDRQRAMSSSSLSGNSGGGSGGGGGSTSSSSGAAFEAALPHQPLLKLQQKVQQQVLHAGSTGAGLGGSTVPLDPEQLQQLLARTQGVQPGLAQQLSEPATTPSLAPDGGLGAGTPAGTVEAAGVQSDVGFMLWVRRCRAEEVGTVLRAVKLATEGILDKSELIAKNSAIEQEVDRFYKTLELEWESLPDAARSMYRVQGELAASELAARQPQRP